jgi:tetratricopeptide (TPR) repeat protein
LGAIVGSSIKLIFTYSKVKMNTKAIITSFIFLILSCNSSSSPKEENFTKKEITALANEHFKNKQFHEAIFFYDKLLALDSSVGDHYFKRAYSKTMLYDSRGAILDYKMAIANNCKETQAAYLNIGILYWGILENRDSAVLYVKKCLEINPNNEKAKWKLNDIMKSK